MSSLVVETGAGLNTANSYATKLEADDYFKLRPRSDEWTQRDTTEKEAYLIWATRLLDDNCRFLGQPVKAVGSGASEQALRFPRTNVPRRDFDAIQPSDLQVSTNDPRYYDSTVIPQELKNATAEMALAMIQHDRLKGADDEGASSVATKAGGGKSWKSGRRNRPIIPPHVRSMLRHIEQSEARLERAA